MLSFGTATAPSSNSQFPTPDTPEACAPEPRTFQLRPDGTLLRNSVLIALPPKELAVLRLLMANAGQVVATGSLRRAGWGDVHVSPDSLPRCISSLRARLGSESGIATIYKRGYRFDDPSAHLAVKRPGQPPSTGKFPSPGQPPSSSHDDSPANWNQRLNAKEGTGMDGISAVQGQPQGLPRLLFFPFRIGSGVPESLATGIVEEAMVLFSSAPATVVDVLAASSATTLATRGVPALDAGIKLNANLVLTGSVSLLPVQYRLRAEMFRVSDAVQLWVEDFLLPRESLPLAEAQMAHRIVARISSTFGAAAAQPTSEPDADLDHNNGWTSDRLEPLSGNPEASQAPQSSSHIGKSSNEQLNAELSGEYNREMQSSIRHMSTSANVSVA